MKTLAVALLLGLTPGTPGLGDSYYPQLGNGGYDVGHYDIDLAYRDGKINGITTITATARHGLSRFDLDFLGLTISSLKVNGTAAAYRRDGQELIITPAEGLPEGATFTVEVAYAGRPAPVQDLSLGRSGWLPTTDGAVTVSEPSGSMTWFPVNDHPTDKATFSYRIKVPEGLRVMANGEPDGDRWIVREPLAPYLAFIAIGKWKIKSGRTPGGITNIVAIDPALKDSVDTLFSRVGAATDWAVKNFGPYPFASTGAVVDDLIAGYALETQNRPFFSSNQNDLPTIVHELSHQWFGDSVSVRDWKHIWLNEGFATYAEWLWSEQHGGRTAQSRFDELSSAPASWPGWKVTTGDPGLRRMFDGAGVYRRGALALHAIRMAVGDQTFFRLLPAWTAEHRYGNATTADLRALAERLSGKDLGKVFDQWLFTPRKPPGPTRRGALK